MKILPKWYTFQVETGPFFNYYIHGSSELVGVNRGMVFIPEKGDQVMVGFEHNDSGKPYVMGSMFHGKNGGGGGANNAVKSIILRSGIKFIFNDDEGSVHLEDPSGCTYDMDGKGNIAVNAVKNLTVTVGENMNVSVGKNITTDAGENISMDAGKDIDETAGGDINQTASGDIVETSDNKTETVGEEYTRNSKVSNEVSEDVTLFSEKNNMTLQSGKTVELNSAEKSNLY